MRRAQANARPATHVRLAADYLHRLVEESLQALACCLMLSQLSAGGLLVVLGLGKRIFELIEVTKGLGHSLQERVAGCGSRSLVSRLLGEVDPLDLQC